MSITEIRATIATHPTEDQAQLFATKTGMTNLRTDRGYWVADERSGNPYVITLERYQEAFYAGYLG